MKLAMMPEMLPTPIVQPALMARLKWPDWLFVVHVKIVAWIVYTALDT